MPHFIVLLRNCIFFFNKLKVHGNSVSGKSTSTIFFPTACADFLSLHHILVILAYIPKLHQQKLKTMVSIFFSMRVQSLGWEDSLKEGVATHSSILA